ncbi:DOMON domain-containing protein [Marinobacterium aestuariivivens]|uniref:DOMON domain-containing protein n=1 Tax=Marinobacterium aestuariivivens TaxID=1698799 RepID=A0ABW2A5Q6_9GAMM
MNRYLMALLAGLVSTLLSLSTQANDCGAMDHGQVVPGSELRLCWSMEDDNLHIKAVHPGHVWIGIGWGTRMAGADAVIGRPDIGTVVDSHMIGRRLDDIRTDARSDLFDAAIAVEKGSTILTFSRPLASGDENDAALSAEDWVPTLWAIGDGSGFRRHTQFGVIDINLASGGLREPGTGWVLWLHAVVMLLTWGLVVPLIVLVARYFKVTKGQRFPRNLDNRFWWLVHLHGNVAVVVSSWLVVGGLWVSFSGPELDSLHAKLGILLLCLGIWQLSWGIGRGTKGGPSGKGADPDKPETWRGDHYDMTWRRRLFESVHKASGYLALILTLPTVLSGMFEFRAGWLLILGYLGWVLLLVFIFRAYSLRGHVSTLIRPSGVLMNVTRVIGEAIKLLRLESGVQRWYCSL